MAALAVPADAGSAEPLDPRPSAWLWWSSGKDSAWALHQLRAQGRYRVACLITTLNGVAERVAMHAVRRQLLERQAAAAGLPLITIDLPYPCSNADYEARTQQVLRAAQMQGVQAMAFGDLFLQDVRDYRCRLLQPFGLEPLFPLWGANTAQLAQQMCAAGMRAVLSCLDPRLMPRELAGADYDAALLRALPGAVDPCGENGEFHTFCFAGPMFQRRLHIQRGETVERDGFVFTDWLPE